ncbi:MAG: DUF3427 domain-containing protein [SAR324 cluster bacterium]|nr:DUF3427 domain-containing protein [SAR324 cluster bacterium]
MENEGVYEQLVTQLLRQRLEKLGSDFFIEKQVLDSAESALVLSHFLQKIIWSVLESIPQGNDRLTLQIELSNRLILWLQDQSPNTESSQNLLDIQGHLLTALFSNHNPVAADLKSHISRITPVTGLSQSELFTGSNVGISLDSEIKREILSADKICWIVSFIKWTGIRIFKEELDEFTHSGRQLRIITTTYMGATDLKAVEFLASLPNTEIKLSYNTAQERLHAKSYLFLRNSGFNTAYIGSSNISRSALTNGLEWNLKITTQEIPHIIDKFQNTFETYWFSSDFETFVTGHEESREKLRRALQTENHEPQFENEFYFDIQPLPYQKEILERLAVEREIHNRWKNLIVAATGTGKTVISAFDFQRFYRKKPHARLLFVAHREEILKQALSMFRGILHQSRFGNLWVGGNKPERYDSLFVSVQTLYNQLPTLDLSVDYYDFIIIDEVHHIAAESYRPILSNFHPRILLGLTATPERHDGIDILDDFCGHIAAELRLPDAINRRFLCPFQYFGIDDDVDLSRVSWDRGHYNPSELTRIYTSNDFRCLHILRNMQTILGDIHSIKALAFCVSQDHAQYMAEKFMLNGMKVAVLTSKNTQERVQLRNDLVQGKINILCVVDIFNEGVDIPEIDTLLFLRPTESLTIFLQQLGRGLRLAEGKECLTVLDFVGNARSEYDFHQKFRAIIGKSQGSIVSEIEQNFPHLPLGCSIVLQKKAREVILNNIKNAIVNQKKLIDWIRSYREHTHLPLTLKNFLKINPSVTLEDIYKTKIEVGGGWSRLCVKAGVLQKELNPKVEKSVYKGIANRLLQSTSRSYLRFVTALVSNKFQWNTENEIENQMALMFHYDFWQENGLKLGFSSLQESLFELGKDPILVDELHQIVSLILDSLDFAEYPMNLGYPNALQVHARYSRDQILSSLGEHRFDKKSNSREGVLEIKNRNLEILFVTLQKSEKKFSPTTLYHDYALSEHLFHWQSQNSARPDRGKGLSYIQQMQTGKRIILFVREASYNEYGRAMGFVNLGQAFLESYSGSQPMNIIWRLEHTLPSYLWHDAAKLAIA